MLCEQPELPAPGSSEAPSSLMVLMLMQKAAKLEFFYKDLMERHAHHAV